MAIRRPRERATGGSSHHATRRPALRANGGGTLCRVLARADGGIGAWIGLLALSALVEGSGVSAIPAAARATLSRVFAETQRTMTMPRMALLVPLALAGFCAGVPCSVASESPLRVVTVGGRAELALPGAAGWTAARIRMDLGPGGAARTQRGRLTLVTGSGQALRLAGITQVTLPEGGASDLPTRARLDAGTVWAAVLPGSPPKEQLEVQTSAASVLVGDGGVEVTAGRDGTTLVRVFHGKAACTRVGTGSQWNQLLVEGQELLIPATGQLGPPRKIDRDKIHVDWTTWNEEQDAAGGFRVAPPPK